MFGKLEEDAAIPLASACFFFVLQHAIGPLLDLFTNLHKRLDEKHHTDLHVRVSATIHAIVVCYGSILLMLNPGEALTKDEVNGYEPRAQLYIGIAMGYFIWDTCVCVWYNWGWGFLLHAVFCTVLYGCAAQPFLHYAATLFLLFELSTPLLHLRWLLLQLKQADTVLFKATNYGFALCFFVVRLVLGIPLSWKFVQRPCWFDDGGSNLHFSAVLMSVGNLTLNVLNVFWFVQMVKSATKKRGGKKSE